MASISVSSPKNVHYAFIYVSIYLIGIKKGNIKPILATWLLFVLATILSFITDFKQTGVHGLFADAYNIVDTFATLIIFVVIIFNKNTNKRFNKFERYCLAIVIIIFFVWFVSGQNILAHLAIQAILVVAYFPTLVHLWKAERNTESLSMWSFDSAASALGTVEPLRTMTLLPLVYGIRAVVSTLAVVILIIRLKYKHGNTRK
jgi:hypothetical protein